MKKKAVQVKDATAADAAGWRRLWSAYNAFYQALVPEEVTAETWRRLCDPAVPVFARLAVAESGQVVGFACCVLHWGTWTTAPICYLEDLFVDDSVRGQGIGAALIQDLVDRGRAGAWGRLYWHTRADNGAARRLYDQFAAADDFVRYQMVLTTEG